MLKRLFAGALFAGLSAGVLAAVLQLLFVVPLIQEGELYETGALVHFGPAPETGEVVDPAADPGVDSGVDSATDAIVMPQDAANDSLVRRNIGSFAMFVVTYIGYGLVLVAGFGLAERAGQRITTRKGLIWGLCGFVALQLAPGFGLPPELPGAQAAPLVLRQIWWIGTVLATTAGLAILAFGRGPLVIAAGIGLIAVPHLIGAPTAPFAGVVPPELAAHFVTRVFGIGAVCWVLLGAFAGAIWARDGQTDSS